jgi:hypothetical protein
MRKVFLDPLRLTLHAGQVACGGLDQLQLGARRHQLRHRLLAVSIGTRDQSIDSKFTATSAAASTVSSVGGNVTIRAQKVAIVEARETSASNVAQKFGQSGLTVSVSASIGSSESQSISTTFIQACGAGITVNKNDFSINISGSLGKGSGNGTDIYYTNSYYYGVWQASQQGNWRLRKLSTKTTARTNKKSQFTRRKGTC